jgi:hypothetical protein
MSVDRRGEELTPEPPVTSHGASNERLEIQAWDTGKGCLHGQRQIHR